MEGKIAELSKVANKNLLIANTFFAKLEGGSKKGKAENLIKSRLSVLRVAHQFDPNTNVAVLPDGFVMIVPFNGYSHSNQNY